MNKQGKFRERHFIAGGIEWTHIFGPGTGYTANPIRGCQHQCRWRMPDGNVAICYAEAVATRVARRAYPQGFQHVSFHPEELAAIRKQEDPAGIFIDSMSDLFAQAVTDQQIDDVIQCVVDCPEHIFFSLTKNPTRLPKYFSTWTDQPDGGKPGWIPSNLFLGVSMPPTFMFGKELTEAQQRAWFDKALASLTRCEARVRWVSLEPLSWDCSDILAKYRDKLHWAVIGAASNGARIAPPNTEILKRVEASLAGLPVFYKGNLRDTITFLASQPPPLSNGWSWRQEFPAID